MQKISQGWCILVGSDSSISMPLFCLGGPRKFYITTEKSNFFIEENEYILDRISRRWIDELEELTLARDTLLYLLQDLGFLII